MLFHLQLALLSVLAATSVRVGASPVGTEERQSNPVKCKTIYGGALKVFEFRSVPDPENDLGSITPEVLYLNAQKTIAYKTGNNGTTREVFANFQTCTPNLAGATNKPTQISYTPGAVYYGRVTFLLNGSDVCLAVSNSGGSGPYYVETKPCLDSTNGAMSTSAAIPQTFALEFNSQISGKVYWTGKSKVNKSVLQSGCSTGKFGYKMVVNSHNPVAPIKYMNGRIELGCTSSSTVAPAFAQIYQDFS